MRIGLIDVDGHNYPNLALMKLSAHHKLMGDEVEWYTPWGDRYDIVYKSKVFSFTPDYDLAINADQVVSGGTGYAIALKDGVERYDWARDHSLAGPIEHIYPDYLLYPQYCNDTAYGYLTRGCPRCCSCRRLRCLLRPDVRAMKNYRRRRLPVQRAFCRHGAR